MGHLLAIDPTLMEMLSEDFFDAMSAFYEGFMDSSKKELFSQ
jgi:hypothetical protein